MADAEENGERTEPATPQKREKARRKGSVAKSTDVNSAVILFLGLLVLQVGSTGIGRHLAEVARTMFTQCGHMEVSLPMMQNLLFNEAVSFFIAVGPVIGGLMCLGLIASVAQVGFAFSTEALEPKWSRLNPLNGIKSIFLSKRSIVELLKNLLKIVIVGWVAYSSIASTIEESPALMDGDIGGIVEFMTHAVFATGLKLGLAFLVLALFDYAYQKFQFEQDMKMTKQEVKEEAKSQEGDPQIKSKIRSIQRQIAYKRMMQDVPKADVVVTNPTHFAIALKYDTGKMTAPKVVAKGADLIAQKIKEIAREAHVPIVEDKMLARTLYKSVEIGQEIPEKLFQAVAQVLAYIYSLKNSKYKILAK
jgi:flagellar biosynthetic protein FlhB